MKLQNKVRELKDEIEELEEQIRIKEEDFQQQGFDLKRLENRATTLEDEKRKIESKGTSLKYQFDKLQKSLAEKTEELEDMKASHVKKKKSDMHIIKKAGELEETVIMQANLVKEQQAIIDRLKAQNGQLDDLLVKHTPALESPPQESSSQQKPSSTSINDRDQDEMNTLILPQRSKKYLAKVH